MTASRCAVASCSREDGRRPKEADALCDAASDRVSEGAGDGGGRACVTSPP
jgi:hypothetical protein